MEKLYASKAFLKVAGGRMHTPHPTPGISRTSGSLTPLFCLLSLTTAVLPTGIFIYQISQIWYIFWTVW